MKQISKKLTILALILANTILGCAKSSKGGSSPSSKPTTPQSQNNTLKNDLDGPPKSEQEPIATSPEKIDEDVQAEIDKILQKEKESPVAINTTNNHQFSSLLSEIDLDIHPEHPNSIPGLTLKTRGAKYKLELIENNVNHYEFYCVKDNNNWFNKLIHLYDREKEDQTNLEPLFRAFVDIRHFDNKIIADMEIIDEAPNGSHGVVHAIYLRKKGTIRVDSSDQTPQQAKIFNTDSQVQTFLWHTQITPTVIGEFYYVITDLMTSATRFKFNMSELYYLKSDKNTIPISYALTQPEIQSLPLAVLFSDYIQSSEYKIISRTPPIKLLEMQLNLNLVTFDQNTNETVPVKFILNFP